MSVAGVDIKKWGLDRIKLEEINKYLPPNGKDFIDDDLIQRSLEKNKKP